MALRPVQVSLLGGTLASFLFRAAEDLVPGVFDYPTPLPPVCPVLDFPESLHWPSLAVGLLIGLLLGPAIDLLYLFRVWWSAAVRERLAVLRAQPGPLFRVL